jgi:hypothetical protein
VDLWSTLKIVWHRWAVTLPILLLFAGMGSYVIMKMPGDFQSNTTVLLSVDSSTNPLIHPDDANAASQALSIVMHSDTVRQSLANKGVTDWELTVRGGQGPFLDVVAHGQSSANASKSASLILDEVTNQLAVLQRDATAANTTKVSAQVLSAPSTPQAHVGSKVRVAVGLGVLGLGLAGGAAIAVEGLQRARLARLELAGAEAGELRPEPLLVPPPVYEQTAPVTYEEYEQQYQERYTDGYYYGPEAIPEPIPPQPPPPVAPAPAPMSAPQRDPEDDYLLRASLFGDSTPEDSTAYLNGDDPWQKLLPNGNGNGGNGHGNGHGSAATAPREGQRPPIEPSYGHEYDEWQEVSRQSAPPPPGI